MPLAMFNRKSVNTTEAKASKVLEPLGIVLYAVRRRLNTLWDINEPSQLRHSRCSSLKATSHMSEAIPDNSVQIEYPVILAIRCASLDQNCL